MKLFTAFPFFQSSKARVSDSDVVDQVILFTKNIIARADLVEGILKTYESANHLDQAHSLIVRIQTYFALEQFIINNKPLVVQKVYTKDSLRDELSHHVDTNKLPDIFRLVFLSKNEQMIMLFGMYTNSLAKYLSSQMGSNKLESIISSLQESHSSFFVTVTDGAIDFSDLLRRFSSFSSTDLTQYFALLNQTLFFEISNSVGSKSAVDITQKNYETIKELYDYDLISEYLSVIPGGILDRERLAYLTREDLEREASVAVGERVRREMAEKSAQELSQTVTELKENKETILHLLDESHKLEVDLRVERDRIQAILSSMNEGIFVVNKDYRITLINQSACKLLGVTSDAANGKNIFDILPLSTKERPLPKEESPVFATLQTGKVVVADIENSLFYSPSSDKRFPVMISTAPLFENNIISGAVVVFRDITGAMKYEETLREEKKIIEQKVQVQTRELSIEKQELQKALEKVKDNYLQAQKSEAQLMASIKGLSLGFVLTDHADVIVAMNAAAKNILDVRSDMHLLSDMDSYLMRTIGFVDRVLECKEAKKSLEFKDWNFVNKVLRVTFTPIFLDEANKDYIGTVILIEDVTEAKTLERTKDEFFAIASHELRTPLTAIRGYSSLIKDFYSDKITDKDVMSMIDYMDKSCVHLIDIVNEFLNVSRLEQGRIDFKIEPFNITELISEIGHEVGNLAEKKQLYLHIDPISASLHTVSADRERTKQVLSNLVGNAIKFTETGGITISVEEKDGFALVRVKDTGKGIDSKYQNMLFKKFQQVSSDPLTRDVNQGSGLGLYISKKIVENMGGKIYLENSEDQKGSTFLFMLPVFTS